ncbi:Uncharacterized protein FKW44_011183 [Caligus rogercresseyi]|uniref:Uncharacterized protein n=1 Tax=Caligus rogercresseyi TaxID=217165 RepID=A0A7T8HHX2_CALRO|nr:Uncharacterized protein FKW44_011183 [Caligus rogercresseyi]
MRISSRSSKTPDSTFPRDSHRDLLWNRTTVWSEPISSHSAEKIRPLTGLVFM